MKRHGIFVFGSNERGRHGAGAARFAADYFGAVEGQGRGRQGQSYAIPTKDRRLRTLPLDVIHENVAQFIHYAAQHPEFWFFVTRIGCGLAGYDDEDIAPFFEGHTVNCYLDPAWIEILSGRRPAV